MERLRNRKYFNLRLFSGLKVKISIPELVLFQQIFTKLQFTRVIHEYIKKSLSLTQNSGSFGVKLKIISQFQERQT